MADNRKFASVLAKRLKTDISASDTTFKLPDIKWYTGSDGVDVNLSSSDFGSVAYGVWEPNTSRQEFFTWDPTTIANYASTGISILARGLPWSADYTTEASSRKWGHDGGTKVLLMTNAPDFYNQFANKNNEETIANVWTFTSTVRPKYNVHPTFVADEELIDKKYADDLAIAGAPDGSTTVKGIFEEATLAEVNAATAAGGTSARLAVNPSTLAQSVAANRYGADAGSTDDYVIATPGVVPAYVVGQRYTFKANTINTGPATLAVDGLAATAIVKDVNVPLVNGDIKANQIVEVVYDGTNFQMISSNGSVPIGAILPFHARTVPSGFLLADGTAYSRTTYAALFAVMFESLGTFTVTIATPGVVTITGHGLATGDAVYLTTTGALPTGLAINTRYWVVKVNADTFTLATSLANALAGTVIATTGSQSGVHTARLAPAGIGDGTTTFNVPDYKAKFLVGKDQSDTGFAGLGQTGGAKTVTLTTNELPAHTHTIPSSTSASSGNVIDSTVALATGETTTSSSTGSGAAFSILNPYAATNFIIKA